MAAPEEGADQDAEEGAVFMADAVTVEVAAVAATLTEAERNFEGQPQK